MILQFKPMFTWDYTQSLSILLNFGPEGWNNDLLFSSDFYDPDRCPNKWEIWDPFTEVCRPIECNEDFDLVRSCDRRMKSYVVMSPKKRLIDH